MINVLYQNRQWSVTEHGLENHQGPRCDIPWPDIRPTQTNAHGWEWHMAEKTWVDLEAFCDAYQHANAMKAAGYTPPKRRNAP